MGPGWVLQNENCTNEGFLKNIVKYYNIIIYKQFHLKIPIPQIAVMGILRNTLKISLFTEFSANK